MDPTVEKDEYKKCPKGNTFKLWLAFVLGMSAMIIATAIFDYISRQQRFKLLPAREGLGGDPDYSDSPSEDVSPGVYESKNVSYQMKMRPVLGIEVMEIDDLGQSRKVFITKVVKGSPAEEAGLMRGDEIVRFDRRKIGDIAKLQEIISKKTPEERVKIEILRAEKLKFMYIKMGSLITDDQIWNGKNLAQANFEQGSTHSSGLKTGDQISTWGMSLAPWTEELARRYGLESSEKGIIVEKVIPDSKASKAGLMAGDLIRALNQKPTPNLKSFFDVLQKEGRALLDVSRQGQSVYLVIPQEDDKPLCKRLKEDG